MSSLTLFSCPKPFTGSTAVQQRNAIGTWLRLDPRPQILLIGDDEGVAETAAELGVRHIPGVATSDLGTPLVDSLFQLAKANTDRRFVAYVNADILLLDDFAAAVVDLERALDAKGQHKVLMCAQRIEVDVEGPLDFAGATWREDLREQIERGVCMNDDAIDLFLVNRDLYDRLLPLAIGRTAWDNYLLWQARHEGAIVVDGSEHFRLGHQTHAYGHAGGWEAAWRGPEAVHNRELVGERIMTRTQASTHVLRGHRLVAGKPRVDYDRGALAVHRLDLALRELERGDVDAAQDFVRDARQWIADVGPRLRELEKWVGQLEEAKDALEKQIRRWQTKAERLSGRRRRLLGRLLMARRGSR